MSGNEFKEITARLAGIEKQLEALNKTVEPLVDMRIDSEMSKLRIASLEDCNRESRKARWRIFASISAALIAGIGSAIAQFWR